MVKTEFDIGSKCRCCFLEEKNMHHLFGEFDQGLSLSDILKSTTAFEIEEDDGFSQVLCENCTTIIVDFFNLKVIYQENETYIKSLTEEVHSDSNEVQHSADENTVVIQSNDEESETHENVEITVSNNLKHDQFKESVDEGSEIINDNLDLNVKSNVIKENLEINNSNTFHSTPENVEITSCTKKYTCDECGDCFLKYLGFQQHMIQKHKKSFVDFDKYTSDTVIKIPVTSVNVKGEEISLECVVSTDEFENYSDIDLPSDNDYKKYICERCGAKFLKKSYLDDHAEIHTTEKRHVCPICGKAFRRRTVLVKHKKLHTHPRQCICERCGLRFNDKGTLKTHIMLKHTKERNYYCKICGLWFPLKSTLDKHIFRHDQNREKQFICKICHMAYKDKSSLNRHVVVKHTKNLKKPSCDYCGKLYTTNTNLLKHLRLFHYDSSKDQQTNVVVD